MKKLLRLTESDLHKIIENSVKRVINEIGDTVKGQEALGRVAGRAQRNFSNRTLPTRDRAVCLAADQRVNKYGNIWGPDRNSCPELDAFNKGWYKEINEAHGEPDSVEGVIGSSILDGYQTDEMAEEDGCSREEAAARWFADTFEDDWENGTLPKYREYVMDINEIGAQLYYDYGADYYFIIPNQ